MDENSIPEIDINEISFDLKSETPKEMLIEAIDAVPDMMRQASLLMLNNFKEEFYKKLENTDENFVELPDAAKELYLEQALMIFIDALIDDMKTLRLKLKDRIPSNEVLDDMSDDEFEEFFESVGDDIQKFLLDWVDQLNTKLKSDDFDFSAFDPLSAND